MEQQTTAVVLMKDGCNNHIWYNARIRESGGAVVVTDMKTHLTIAVIPNERVWMAYTQCPAGWVLRDDGRFVKGEADGGLATAESY